jgi:hypothetical protein
MNSVRLTNEMFDENAPLDMAPSSFLKLSDATIDIKPKKVKELLYRFHGFPTQHRKELWSYILQLPQNATAFDSLMKKAQLPQAERLCHTKGCGKSTLAIVNALIHWHAPLINCDWLPPLVQKLVHGFPKESLFSFEVVITFLTNFFSEWTSDVPGPPPEVLSRIDAIFSNHDPQLRDDLGTAIVVWPVYRSIFAELLYDRNWLDLMDHLICSTPQFLEFLVVAWMDVNGPQLRIDHSTFHSTRRATNVNRLILTARKIGTNCSPTLVTHQRFHPLSSPHYPVIEANRDAIVLRTLQSDHHRLAVLQQQLQEERRQTDETEKIKERRRQTFDSIQQLHRAKEDEERIETAKAASALDQQMKRLRLEGRLLRQADERQFLEAWQSDWEMGIDMGTGTGIMAGIGIGTGDAAVDEDGIRFQAMTGMRNTDLMTRDSRRASAARAYHAKSELDSQMHQRAMQNEVRRLENNPVLLAKATALKPSKRREPDS